MNETADRWLIFAQDDLRAAEILLEKEVYNQSCFHAQQCVEKALKALLICHQGHMPPKIHVTVDLLSLLPLEWFTDMEVDSLGRLDDYYITTRYPDALPGDLPTGLPGKAEAEEAAILARAVLEKSKQLMQIE